MDENIVTHKTGFEIFQPLQTANNAKIQKPSICLDICLPYQALNTLRGRIYMI